MRMNPNEIGKKLGIGVRVAGRIAQQRAQERAAEAARTQNAQNSTAASQTAQTFSPSAQNQTQTPPTRPVSLPEYAEKARRIGKNSHKYTRAAGRGLGGFIRPFSRVGGILWLEVTGFFFGLFALFFAINAWRTRASYANDPGHWHLLTAIGLTGVFAYLSISAFWRARRR
jgi:hypothetical protein